MAANSNEHQCCKCRTDGYRGRHCELKANTCGPDTCDNGGTCFPQPSGGFLCECPSPNFSGMRCNNEVMGIPQVKLYRLQGYNGHMRQFWVMGRD